MYTISKIKIAAAKPIFGLVQKPTPMCYIGAGKVKKAAALLHMNHVQRVLIVTDSSLKKLGLLDPMLAEIRDSGIEIFLYDQVKPDPTFDITDAALKICEENRCQAVLAFGGGSVIDTAKVVSVSYTNQKSPRQLEGLLKVKKVGLPFIVVPTTAGTGSETTIAAVISDPATHKKTTIVDPKIVPMAAILDPELTAGLPVSITAQTAMDALTHALEAYVGTYATEETDRYAIASIGLIYENLEKILENPADLEAREALLVASFLGGMAFTRTYVGYVHAFAHNLGGRFGIPHGLANAVLLPHVMEKYLPVCAKRFGVLSDRFGLCDGKKTEIEKGRAFVDSIFRLNDTMSIPKRLEKFPQNAVDDMVQAAFGECHGTYPVPCYFTKAEAKNILFQVCAK